MQPDGRLWAGHGEGGVADREAVDGEERGECECELDAERGLAVQGGERAADFGCWAERSGHPEIRSQQEVHGGSKCVG